MPKSSTSFETFASPDELHKIVVDVEKYPAFLPEVKRVVVRSRDADGFVASFDIQVKVGSIEVKTEYTVKAYYEAEIETSLPIAPELQKMFADNELPKMMQRFRDRAEG